LHSDVLTCIAASGPAETQPHGPYRTSEHAAFDRAITTGEIVDVDAQVVVPVGGEAGIGGIIVIEGTGGLDEGQRTALATIARIVSLGMRQAATVTELQLEA
jgi:hypothetical protein